MLVDDVPREKDGRLSVVPLVLRKAYVTCVNEQNAITKYLKFVIKTRKNKWRFSVKINGLGGVKYVDPTWYQIAWCFAIAFAVVLLSYCCMKKAETDREAGKVGLELGHVERIDDEDLDDTRLDRTQMQDSSDEDSDDDMNISL